MSGSDPGADNHLQRMAGEYAEYRWDRTKGEDEITSQLRGGADQVNLIELVQYLKDSYLAQKVSGYAEKAAQDSMQDGESRISSSSV
jgi:hypothetical protein